MPDSYWAHPDGAYISIGVFLDREGHSYFVLGNRKFDKPNETTLTFTRPIERVQFMDKETGNWKPMTIKIVDGKQTVRIPLEEAGVEMVWAEPTPLGRR